MILAFPQICIMPVVDLHVLLRSLASLNYFLVISNIVLWKTATNLVESYPSRLFYGVAMYSENH